MPDDEVCVGDRYRIGGATFEVTQPRVTCFKVGMRLEEPRMPALLYSHGRPGFYLRVLEEGDVGAGDVIDRVAIGPGAMSVREVARCSTCPDTRPAAGCARALAIPALSDGWRGSFEALLEQHENGAGGNQGLAPPSTSPAWPGLRPFRVAATARRATRSARSCSNRLTANRCPSSGPGSSSRSSSSPRGSSALLRSYSLAVPTGEDGYRIAVKREADGFASGFLHDRIAESDVLEVGAPRGGFTLDVDEPGPVVLLSAGVGVTPVLAMLGALAQAGSEREVWWVHGARSGPEHAFADEARELVAKLPAARSHVRYSRPGAEDRKGRDFDDAGRVDLDALIELGCPEVCRLLPLRPVGVPERSHRRLAGMGRRARIGSTARCSDRSLRDDAPDPHPPAGPPGRGGDRLQPLRADGPWDERYGSLLELAEACDVPAEWSCRTGVCHRCESGLVDGAVAYEPEPLDDPRRDRCCCAARGRPSRSPSTSGADSGDRPELIVRTVSGTPGRYTRCSCEGASRITASARAPGPRRPRSSRRSARAPPRVAACSASSAVIRISRTASAMQNAMEVV